MNLEKERNNQNMDFMDRDNILTKKRISPSKIETSLLCLQYFAWSRTFTQYAFKIIGPHSKQCHNSPWPDKQHCKGRAGENPI